MTADELHKLVRDWPREAWPEAVEYNDKTVVGSWRTHRGSFILIAHAVLLFEASGARWLERETMAPVSIRYDPTDDYTLVIMSCDDGGVHVGRKWNAPTRIVAIDAAVRAVSKETQE